ncbi:MAG: enoyl-CoA hydratase/isomerase family protein [Actinobacteria bacterium]|nr:enoyl-CoA hydratase/isomerase family protein [Actinomycetota bacterium]
MNKTVLVATDGSIRVISMNRPAQRNAMDTAMLRELILALEAAASDSAVSGMVLTGEAGVFSAGADTSEVLDRPEALARMNLFTELYQIVTGYPKVTVAAIEGHCVGGGAEVASGCDLRVGSSSARIRFPGAQFGIPVGAARLPLLIGLSHSKDLLMTTRTVDGEEAYRMGFLNRLVADGDCLDESVSLAQSAASNPGAVKQKRQLDHLWSVSTKVDAENRALRRWQQDSL